MKLHLGVKSDPIQYRFSFTWLFELMQRQQIHYLQLGSFFELYLLEDGYFQHLREEAERMGVRIKSCFTSHRELGGFLTGDPYLERAARKGFERYILAASMVGADYLGSNIGSIYRDRMELKDQGIECYLKHMRELMKLAQEAGLKALTIEPMSCLAEPPTLPEEIDYLLQRLQKWHGRNPDTTVPVYLCGDISHGLFDREKRIVHDNLSLFEYGIPYMVEFHFKNTDAFYNQTFGFSEQELAMGIIDLARIKEIIEGNDSRWPVDEVVGYLELPGPKLGRHYSDYTLEKMLTDSLTTLKHFFLCGGPV